MNVAGRHPRAQQWWEDGKGEQHRNDPDRKEGWEGTGSGSAGEAGLRAGRRTVGRRTGKAASGIDGMVSKWGR